jgi:hypothetical protein
VSLDVRTGSRGFWTNSERQRMLPALAVGFAAAIVLNGCANHVSRTGDETHFFDCHVDADCPSGGASYRCEKGLCVASAEQPSRSSDAGKGAATQDSAASMPLAMPSSRPGEVGGGALSDARAPVAKHGNQGGRIVDAGEAMTSADAETPPTGNDAAIPPMHLLLETTGFITATAMDDARLYFVTESLATTPGSFYSVPKDGSAPAKALATAPTYVEGIAVDDGFVYFTDLVAGTINRLPKSGGQPQVIATGQTRPWGIAVDGVAVYWANQGTNQAGVPGNAGASVMALTKEASQPVTLAANEQMCSAIVVDGAGGIVWQNGPNGDTNGSLRRLVLSSGSPTSLASRLDLASIPAIAGGRVFWSNPAGFGTDGTLSSVPLTGGMVTTPLTLGSGNGAEPVPVAADSAAVYIAAAEGGLNDGSLRKLSLAKGSLSLISGPAAAIPGLVVRNQIVSLLLDSENLYAFEYWADGGGMHGRVRSVPK